MSEVIHGYRPLFYFLLAFLAGSLFTGLFLDRAESGAAGKLDKRYAYHYGRAAETIGRLEEELEQERHINQELRAKLKVLADFYGNSNLIDSGS